METSVLITIIAIVVGVPLAVVAIVYLVVPFFRLLGLIFRNIYRFVRDTIADLLRSTAHLLTAIVFTLAWLGSLAIAKKPAAAHFLEATHQELMQLGAGLYRLIIGNPARLFGAHVLAEGLEQRVPKVFEQAPATEADAMARKGQFEGYTIVGTLQGGGSGGKLYIAKPDAIKLAGLARLSPEPIDQVVIKSFSVYEGSSLPQIVRESRALEAARKLGLVLDHELTGERFYYVMRYVPGELLGVVTQRLHSIGAPGGLVGDQLAQAISIGCDLLATLDQYHRAGLWHKDIKPDNIIVSTFDAQTNIPPRAQLVDFGLVTPLRSSMTLTTHGTEYFRDPEMVRMALRGVKVGDVDGAKFDLYGAGAVLFSIIENSFPAHGGLSQLTKHCPDALRWIVRRAMTDYEKRYANAQAMLADLRAVQQAHAAGTLEKLKPTDLPSATLTRAAEDLPPAELETDAPLQPAFSESLASDGTPLGESIARTPVPASSISLAASSAAVEVESETVEHAAEKLATDVARRKVAVFTGAAPPDPTTRAAAPPRPLITVQNTSASDEPTENPADRWRRSMRIPVIIVSVFFVLFAMAKLFSSGPRAPSNVVVAPGTVPAPAPALEPVQISLDPEPDQNSLAVMGQNWIERMKGQMSAEQIGSIKNTIDSVEKTVEMLRQAKAQQQANTSEQMREHMQKAEALEKALRDMFRDPNAPAEPAPPVAAAPETPKPKPTTTTKPLATERVKASRMLILCDEGLESPRFESAVTRSRASGFQVLCEKQITSDKAPPPRDAVELAAALREKTTGLLFGTPDWKEAFEEWEGDVPAGQRPTLVVWYRKQGTPARATALLLPTRACDAKSLRVAKALLSRVEQP